MIKQSVLQIDASSKSFKIEDVKDPEIIGPIDFGIKQFQDCKDEYLSFGEGLLAGSNIPGTKRMMFTAFSPLWKHFYISTMGGAAYVFHHLGINYVNIKGSCSEYCYMELKRENDEVTVNFYPVDVEKIWKGYDGEIGVYALQKYIFAEHGKDFNACRIMVTGPASMNTRMGAIASAPIVRGEITAVDCWAGRGGLGSKLVQQHKIVGIIFGGDYNEPADSPLRHRDEIDKIFEGKFHKKMITEDMDATTKYRFDPVFNSGGTLGVNFTRLKSWMFSFNYQSVNYTEKERLDIHKMFVETHYLKQFNEETIEKKQFKHCGEPCGAVCKKMNGKFKKDYEPYEALGPNMGVFDQRAAEKINHYADAMGFDAIQVGSLVSWIMECLDKGMFPEFFGVFEKPKWDYKKFNVIADSHQNAEIGMKIIDKILNDEAWIVFRKGIRNAAKTMDERYGTESIKYAVYNAFGDDGCMVPNQYWVPGMFSPMAIMGKYFEYYGADYLSPFELGKKNVERMIKELYSDNSGICRFHRAWVEELVGDIIDKLYNVKIDYYKHHRKLAQMINQGNQPVFWESERVVDIIHSYLEKVQSEDPDLKTWLKKFEEDKWKAAKEYWDEILRGIEEGMK